MIGCFSFAEAPATRFRRQFRGHRSRRKPSQPSKALLPVLDGVPLRPTALWCHSVLRPCGATPSYGPVVPLRPTALFGWTRRIGVRPPGRRPSSLRRAVTRSRPSREIDARRPGARHAHTEGVGFDPREYVGRRRPRTSTVAIQVFKEPARRAGMSQRTRVQAYHTRAPLSSPRIGPRHCIREQPSGMRAVAMSCRRTRRGNRAVYAEVSCRKALAGSVLGRPPGADRGMFPRRNRPQNTRQAIRARNGLLVGEMQRNIRTAQHASHVGGPPPLHVTM